MDHGEIQDPQVVHAGLSVPNLVRLRVTVGQNATECFAEALVTMIDRMAGEVIYGAALVDVTIVSTQP